MGTRRRMPAADFDPKAGPQTVQSSFSPEQYAAMQEQDRQEIRQEIIEKLKRQGAIYATRRRMPAADFDPKAGPKTVQSSFSPEQYAAMQEQDRQEIRQEIIEKLKRQGAI